MTLWQPDLEEVLNVETESNFSPSISNHEQPPDGQVEVTDGKDANNTTDEILAFLVSNSAQENPTSVTATEVVSIDIANKDPSPVYLPEVSSGTKANNVTEELRTLVDSPPKSQSEDEMRALFVFDATKDTVVESVGNVQTSSIPDPSTVGQEEVSLGMEINASTVHISAPDFSTTVSATESDLTAAKEPVSPSVTELVTTVATDSVTSKSTEAVTAVAIDLVSSKSTEAVSPLVTDLVPSKSTEEIAAVATGLVATAVNSHPLPEKKAECPTTVSSTDDSDSTTDQWALFDSNLDSDTPTVVHASEIVTAVVAPHVSILSEMSSGIFGDNTPRSPVDSNSSKCAPDISAAEPDNTVVGPVVSSVKEVGPSVNELRALFNSNPLFNPNLITEPSTSVPVTESVTAEFLSEDKPTVSSTEPPVDLQPEDQLSAVLDSSPTPDIATTVQAIECVSTVEGSPISLPDPPPNNQSEKLQTLDFNHTPDAVTIAQSREPVSTVGVPTISAPDLLQNEQPEDELQALFDSNPTTVETSTISIPNTLTKNQPEDELRALFESNPTTETVALESDAAVGAPTINILDPLPKDQPEEDLRALFESEPATDTVTVQALESDATTATNINIPNLLPKNQPEDDLRALFDSNPAPETYTTVQALESDITVGPSTINIPDPLPKNQPEDDLRALFDSNPAPETSTSVQASESDAKVGAPTINILDPLPGDQPEDELRALFEAPDIAVGSTDTVEASDEVPTISIPEHLSEGQVEVSWGTDASTDELRAIFDSSASNTSISVPTAETTTTVAASVGMPFLIPSSEDAEVAAFLEGAQYKVVGEDGAEYSIAGQDTSCTTFVHSLEEQMRALHGPSPDQQHEVVVEQPPTHAPTQDLLSMVVEQTIPLRLDLASGEMVPDVEAGRNMVATDRGGWVEPDQQEVLNIISDSLEVFPPDIKVESDLIEPTPAAPLKEAKPTPKPSKVATVKPFPSTNTLLSKSLASSKVKQSKPPSQPLQFKAVLSSLAKSSSQSRTSSSVKCQCARHTVIGYPPSSCSYWTVGTTPGITSTILDFDNTGTRFLYEQGDLKSFQAVLSSFKPEFLTSERVLEVSLCLSCVQWAEKEASLANLKKRLKEDIKSPLKDKPTKTSKVKKVKPIEVKEKNDIEKPLKISKEKKVMPRDQENNVQKENLTNKPRIKLQKKSQSPTKFDSDQKKLDNLEVLDSEAGVIDLSFSCLVCQETSGSVDMFCSHMKEAHCRGVQEGNRQAKRSGTSSKCSCLVHTQLFQAYSWLGEHELLPSGLGFRMSFGRSEELSRALKILRTHKLLADNDHSLLCSYCLHFGSKQCNQVSRRRISTTTFSPTLDQKEYKLHPVRVMLTKLKSALPLEVIEPKSSEESKENIDQTVDDENNGMNTDVTKQASSNNLTEESELVEGSGSKTGSEVVPINVSSECGNDATEQVKDSCEESSTNVVSADVTSDKETEDIAEVAEGAVESIMTMDDGANKIETPIEDSIPMKVLHSTFGEYKTENAPSSVTKSEVSGEKLKNEEASSTFTEDVHISKDKSSVVDVSKDKSSNVDISMEKSSVQTPKTKVSNTLKGLAIDMVEDLFSPGTGSSRSGRSRRREDNSEESPGISEISPRSNEASSKSTNEASAVPEIRATRSKVTDNCGVEGVSVLPPTIEKKSSPTHANMEVNSPPTQTRASRSKSVVEEVSVSPKNLKQNSLQTSDLTKEVDPPLKVTRASLVKEVEHPHKATRANAMKEVDHSLKVTRSNSNKEIDNSLKVRELRGNRRAAQHPHKDTATGAGLSTTVKRRRSENLDVDEKKVSNDKVLRATGKRRVSENLDVDKKTISSDKVLRTTGKRRVSENLNVDEKNSSNDKILRTTGKRRVSENLDVHENKSLNDKVLRTSRRTSVSENIDQKKSSNEKVLRTTDSDEVSENLEIDPNKNSNDKSTSDVRKAAAIADNDQKKSSTEKENKMLAQLKMDMVSDAVLPSSDTFLFTGKRRVGDQSRSLRDPRNNPRTPDLSGNKMLAQLNMDMVVGAVLPTGKRRAVDRLESGRKAKVAKVEKVPSRQMGYATKLFVRIFEKEISRSEGFRCLSKRVPGLLIQGFHSEYKEWAKGRESKEDMKETKEVKEFSINLGESKSLVNEDLEKTLRSVVNNELTLSEAAKRHSMKFANMHRMLTSFKASEKQKTAQKAVTEDKNAVGDNKRLEQLRDIKARIQDILQLPRPDLGTEEKAELLEIKDVISQNC